MTRLLIFAGSVVLLAALSHPRGRMAVLRFAYWPARDFLRAQWDERERSRVEVRPEWLQ